MRLYVRVSSWYCVWHHVLVSKVTTMSASWASTCWDRHRNRADPPQEHRHGNSSTTTARTRRCSRAAQWPLPLPSRCLPTPGPPPDGRPRCQQAQPIPTWSLRSLVCLQRVGPLVVVFTICVCRLIRLHWFLSSLRYHLGQWYSTVSIMRRWSLGVVWQCGVRSTLTPPFC